MKILQMFIITLIVLIFIILILSASLGFIIFINKDKDNENSFLKNQKNIYKEAVVEKTKENKYVNQVNINTNKKNMENIHKDGNKINSNTITNEEKYNSNITKGEFLQLLIKHFQKIELKISVQNNLNKKNINNNKNAYSNIKKYRLEYEVFIIYINYGVEKDIDIKTIFGDEFEEEELITTEEVISVLSLFIKEKGTLSNYRNKNLNENEIVNLIKKIKRESI